MFKALILLIAICPIQQRVEKIRLKYVEPNTVMQQLHLAGPSAVLPVGIYQVVFDPTDNSIIVKGEADAIAQLKAAIARLDVDSAGKVVPIKNVAAQFMLERLVGTPSEPIASLLPAGVTIAVDPSRNALLVRGTSEGIR